MAVRKPLVFLDNNDVAELPDGDTVPAVGTNLGQIPGAISIALTSSTGTGTVLVAAVGGIAGLMSGADKTKMDGIAAGATVGADWNTNVTNKPTLGTASAEDVGAFDSAGSAAAALSSANSYTDSGLSGKAGKGVAETITGDWEFTGAGPAFRGAATRISGQNPTLQLRSEGEARGYRLRGNITDADDGPFVIGKWNGSSWDNIFSLTATTAEVGGVQLLKKSDADASGLLSVSPTVSNLDTMVGSTARFFRAVGGATGIPPAVSASGGVGLYIPYSASIGSQFWHATTSNRMFMRGYNGGWSAWKEVTAS